MFLVYIIIRNVLVNGPRNGMEECLQSNFFHLSKFLVTKQLDYGKKTLLETFLYPGWYSARCKSKARVKRQINGRDLIICMCLLLSGDIHQCPGPVPDFGPRNAADLGGGVHGDFERTELGLGNITVSLDECKQPMNSDPQLCSVQPSHSMRFWRMPAKLSQMWTHSFRQGDFTCSILTSEAFSLKSQRYVSSVTAIRWDFFVLLRHGWMTPLQTLKLNWRTIS